MPTIHPRDCIALIFIDFYRISLKFMIIVDFSILLTDRPTDGQMDGWKDGWTNGRTDEWADTAFYRDTRTHLKSWLLID